jgi:hypothetical protein
MAGGTQFFYGSTGDLPLAGKWIARCANGELPLPSVGCTILQALPTNTRRPTRTPEPCEITSVSNPVRLRIAPSLHEESWLVEIPTAYTYLSNFVVSGAALPNRPWLWVNGNVPPSLTIHSIRAIASAGIISWIDPDVDWLQVVLGTNIGNLTGYLTRTDASGNQILSFFSCNLGALPTPTPDPGMPSSTLSQFANFPPQSHVFDGNQPPSVMGACGQHVGSQNPCSPDLNGSTIDIVPRNHELCIDTVASWRIAQCDSDYDSSANPNPVRIPVYAPQGGCATFDNTFGNSQVVIRLFRPSGSGNQAECNTPIQNGDLLIVLTHITNSPILSSPNRQPISANTFVGYLCLNKNGEAYNICAVYAPTVPTHLAFQLQAFSGSYRQAPNDIVGYLARQGCLYDNWKYNQGNPQVQDSPIIACP